MRSASEPKSSAASIAWRSHPAGLGARSSRPFITVAYLASSARPPGGRVMSFLNPTRQETNVSRLLIPRFRVRFPARAPSSPRAPTCRLPTVDRDDGLPVPAAAKSPLSTLASLPERPGCRALFGLRVAVANQCDRVNQLAAAVGLVRVAWRWSAPNESSDRWRDQDARPSTAASCKRCEEHEQNAL